MASPLQAKNYTYTLSITGENGNKCITYHDYAKPLDKGYDEIIEKKSVLMIGTQILKELRNEENLFEIEARTSSDVDEHLNLTIIREYLITVMILYKLNHSSKNLKKIPT